MHGPLDISLFPLTALTLLLILILTLNSYHAPCEVFFCFCLFLYVFFLSLFVLFLHYFFVYLGTIYVINIDVNSGSQRKCWRGETSRDGDSHAVASSGFVARRGKAGDYVMGHSRRTSGPGAADCSITNSLVTNAVLIERAVSCWHLHRLTSQTTWLSDLLRS